MELSCVDYAVICVPLEQLLIEEYLNGISSKKASPPKAYCTQGIVSSSRRQAALVGREDRVIEIKQ